MYLTLGTICDKMLLRLNLSGYPELVKKKMVGRVRFELTTNSLKGYCSTIELPTHVDAQAGIEPAQKTFAESRLTIRPLRG